VRLTTWQIWGSLAFVQVSAGVPSTNNILFFGAIPLRTKALPVWLHSAGSKQFAGQTAVVEHLPRKEPHTYIISVYIYAIRKQP
jgi:hypothetical protein